jgi:hypothetical protein
VTAAPPPGGGAYAAPPPGGAHSRGDDYLSDVSVGQLLGDVTRDLSTLMRQELALAQAELKQEATKTGKAAGVLGGAGFAGYMTVLFLSLALWAGLSNLMDPGWAALIVAVIWAVVAAILYAAGRAKMRQVHPRPDRTVETLSNVPDALKGQRGGTP